MKIAIFGGSFDPVHNGHLSLASSAKNELRLDRVFFVPSGISAHKNKIFASKADRVNMLKAALSGSKRFKVSLYEITKRKPSYSYETIRYFKKKFPRAEIIFLVGNDSIVELNKWNKGYEILSMCRFVSGRRPGSAVSGVPFRYRKRILFLKNPVVNISSTAIRKKIALGEDVSSFVPAKVLKYINSKGLYEYL